MTIETDQLREPLKEAILHGAGLLVTIAQQYSETKTMLGEALALYQRRYGGLDFALPAGLQDALSMGKAPGIAGGRGRRTSNAVRAAISLTRRGEVMVPLKLREIHARLLAEPDLVGTRPPSLATLQSTIIRSGLFERIPGGRWRLMRPVDLSETEGGQLHISTDS